MGRSLGAIALYSLLFLLFQFGATAQVSDSLRKKVFNFLNQNYKGYPALAQSTRQIGHRLTGSNNGKAAEEFIFTQLKSFGIQEVVFDTFPVNAWKRKTCQLEVVPYRSDNFLKIKAVSLANTPSADASLHLIDGGDGLESDIKKLGPALKGKCLVINLGLTKTDSGRQNLHRAEKVSLAIKYGAGAVIMVHPQLADILLTGTASLSGEVIPIPALCVSGKDGAEIRNWMKTERLMAQIRVKNEVAQGQARNVLAKIPAPVKTEETILFCGHLDSWDLSTGATDNGLGAFTLLDIARAFHHMRPFLKRNVFIMWTMGEEQGLLGSRHRSKAWQKENQIENLKAVVNLDMAGMPKGLNHFDWPGAEAWFKKATLGFSNYEPSYQNQLVGSPGLHSDHQPFMLQGIPAFSSVSNLPDSIYKCYHASCDDLPLVRPVYLESSALIHSLLGLELAISDRLPFTAMKPKKLKKWLEKHNLKEKLIISNEWPWKN